MLKEKWNQLLKGEGNHKKKIENLVFFLVILMITIIAINMIWKEDKPEESNTKDTSKKLASQETATYEGDSLEAKLETILSNINGVGKVSVLITYNETEELVPVYNQSDKKTTTNEVDSGGGTRVIEEQDSSKEVVYENEKMVIQKTITPKVEGAIITATGASNATVKANIIQAVEAATGLATHKIQVFEKQN